MFGYAQNFRLFYSDSEKGIEMLQIGTLVLYGFTHVFEAFGILSSRNLWHDRQGTALVLFTYVMAAKQLRFSTLLP